MELPTSNAWSSAGGLCADVTLVGGVAAKSQHSCGQLKDITQIALSFSKLRPSPCGGVKWNLVWCHEWSHIPDTFELRNALFIQARNIGAKFILLKKAKHFHDWAMSNRNPYLLITDWREVKHCLETMDTIKRPIFTAVFCNDEKQHKKAQRWTSKLAKRVDPVHTFQGRPSLKPLMPILQQEEVDSFDGTDDKIFCDDNMTEPCMFQELKQTHDSVQLPVDVLFQPWKVPRESRLLDSNQETHLQAFPVTRFGCS